MPADKIPSSCDKTQPHSPTVLLPTGISGLVIQCELGLSLGVPADKIPSSGGVTLLEQYHALLLPGNKTPWSGDVILPYHALLLPGNKTSWSGDVILPYQALLLPGNKTPWSDDILQYHALLLPGNKTPRSSDIILPDHDVWQC